jgi:hypothetical protein
MLALQRSFTRTVVQASAQAVAAAALRAEAAGMKPTTLLRAAAGAAAAVALAAAPAQASPSVPVCNQASPHFQGGGLVALDPPVDSPAARYTDDLSPLPGQGEGLVNAASHSPALTVCGEGDGGPILDT